MQWEKLGLAQQWNQNLQYNPMTTTGGTSYYMGTAPANSMTFTGNQLTSTVK